MACGGGGGGGNDNGAVEATRTSTPGPSATPLAPTETPLGPTATPLGPSVAPTPAGEVHAQAIVVDSGPKGTYVNGLFASATICVPGSVTCVTVDHLLVDTGSSGLRILASVLPLTLPAMNDTGGSPVAECFPFLDAFTWGPIRTADVTVGGQTARNLPMQIVGEPAFPAPPDGCTSSGLSEADTLDTLGTNGILGVGVFRQDCGAFCASTAGASGDVYFSCAGATCTAISWPVEQQVQNPVWLMPEDNNGVVIELPSVPEHGTATVSGTMTLGLGTNAANDLDDAHVIPLTSAGTFTTVLNGDAIPVSFVDTGSNGFFFLDSATTGIAPCNGNADFYCPPATLSLQAAQHATGDTQTQTVVSFDVANAGTLFANEQAFAYGNLAGPGPNMFDWGLPFFYGRRVLLAIEGQSTPAGPGPYVAY
jgi:hypothetical protein